VSEGETCHALQHARLPPKVTAVADDFIDNLQMAALDRRNDLRIATLLCGITVGWNALAGSAAVAIGFATHSLALAGFGLNAAVDSVASATLVWRFKAEGRDESRATAVERKALQVVGITLFVIAVYIAVRATIALIPQSTPDSSTGGLVVAAASVLVLSPLAYGKGRLARRLESRALRGDSVLSGVGAALAAVALLGAGLTAVANLWWADSLGALIMSAILLREALAALHASRVGQSSSR
jgi:divalent metal cation (Fe/Co/Zn/Cd) transporter